MFKDRIKELRRVKAAELFENPKNWRKHPKNQRKALEGALAEIGIADALLATETEDGSLMLIDGHLRKELLPDQEVPVLVLDLNEEESDKLLASLDPLSAMAEMDKDALKSLLDGLETQSEGLSDLLEDLNIKALEDLEEEPEAEDGQSIPDHEVDIPERFQIVVECEDEEDLHTVYDQFVKDGLNCRIVMM